MTTFEEQLQGAIANSYDIERELGGGGMSRVFVAIDKSLGRKVVIKLLSPELTAEVNRGRFRREIQVAAQLQHPHIVPLLSAGEYEDLVWYTMPFISGESLKSAIEKRGPMPVVDVVRVLYHVGEALDYAHAEGVIHRDIKPANILRSGTYALVTDFGVAKALNAAMPSSGGMTATGTAVGTPAYMAPEQLAGEVTADHRIDIYALGLLAYELLKGKSPFAANTAQRVLVAVLTEDPQPLREVRPDVPQSLSDLVMRCLAKDPAERPTNARELLNGLDMFSTASGEIRTAEHRVPKAERKIPPGVSMGTPTEPAPALTDDPTIPPGPPPAELTPSAVPALAPTMAVPVGQTAFGEPTPTEEQAPVADEIPLEPPGYVPHRPRNNRKLLIGGLAVLIPVVAGAIIMSQRSGGTSEVAPVAPTPAPAPVATAPITDSTALTAAPTPLPAAAAVPNVDSIRADSVKKAKAAAAKKAALAKADSLKRADSVKKAQAAPAAPAAGTNPRRVAAQSAAAGMLSNAQARAKFNEGATHKGGVLGTRKSGDLQTQIDAITPFLRGAGLSYDQFKSIVAEAGFNIFDEKGRMIPSVVEAFAGSKKQ